MEFFLKTPFFLIENFLKNGKFSQKSICSHTSKFFSKIENFLKNPFFSQKSIFSQKYFQVFIKNQNFYQK